jgi:hypothetical protein
VISIVTYPLTEETVTPVPVKLYPVGEDSMRTLSRKTAGEGPLGPVAPILPVAPVAPISPVAPVAPTLPVAPVAPL